MSYVPKSEFFLGLLLGGAMIGAGCSSSTLSMDSAPVEKSVWGSYDSAVNVDTGFFVSSESGSWVMIPGKSPRPDADPDYAAAQELRLKAREIAAQLLETGQIPVANYVALPTSFVDLNDFGETSPFGRYLAEAMFYEFNQRGIAVREYRMNREIAIRQGQGEFALDRAGSYSANRAATVVLVGTYMKQPQGVFVNARLVRPQDGMVLRTAQLVLPANHMVRRMAGSDPFAVGTLNIRQGNGPRAPEPPAGRAPGVVRQPAPAGTVTIAPRGAAVPAGPAVPQPLFTEERLNEPAARNGTNGGNGLQPAIQAPPMPGPGRNT